MAKVFKGRDIALLEIQMAVFFHHVTIHKPESSRDSSLGLQCSCGIPPFPTCVSDRVFVDEQRRSLCA